MDMFKEHDYEVTLLLMTLRECHVYHAVEFVGGAILEAIKVEKMTLEAAKMEIDVVAEMEVGGKEREVPTLDEILGMCTCSCHITNSGPTRSIPIYNSSMYALAKLSMICNVLLYLQHLVS